MLPKKLHIEQIERFHDTFSKLSDKMKDNKDKGFNEKNYELALDWFELIELWREIDDFIEFKIKYKLDYLKDEQ